jgi:membrane protease YdiL (CAAX protease family)
MYRSIDDTALPSRRFGLLLWAAGFVGAVVLTIAALPILLAQIALPAPLWLILLASFAQSALLLGLAVWAGVALAPSVGLHAPVFAAAASGRPLSPALKPQLLPGLIAGVIGGLLLFAVVRHMPAALSEAQARFTIPLAARVLYGGITEELLLRWGFMTALVWLTWRFLQHRRGAVRAGFVWLAIAISAIVFGAGHLPVAYALVGSMDAQTVVFVISANTAFGLLFGYLYWRYHLESAMIAHALSHVVGALAIQWL